MVKSRNRNSNQNNEEWRDQDINKLVQEEAQKMLLDRKRKDEEILTMVDSVVNWVESLGEEQPQVRAALKTIGDCGIGRDIKLIQLSAFLFGEKRSQPFYLEKDKVNGQWVEKVNSAGEKIPMMGLTARVWDMYQEHAGPDSKKAKEVFDALACAIIFAWKNQCVTVKKFNDEVPAEKRENIPFIGTVFWQTLFSFANVMKWVRVRQERDATSILSDSKYDL